jgi:hypothetical protein
MTLKKGKEFLKSLANFLEQILLGAGLGASPLRGLQRAFFAEL